MSPRGIKPGDKKYLKKVILTLHEKKLCKKEDLIDLLQETIDELKNEDNSQPN